MGDVIDESKIFFNSPRASSEVFHHVHLIIFFATTHFHTFVAAAIHLIFFCLMCVCVFSVFLCVREIDVEIFRERERGY
ncbi:hypothetical protein Hanom_Chr08g00728211 [Helianthus anomalus]